MSDRASGESIAKKREPLTGAELEAFVFKLVDRGFRPMAIARKASIGIETATRLRKARQDQLSAELAGTDSPEDRARLKSDVREYLLSVIDDAKDEVARTRRDGAISSRAHTRGVTAAKQVMAMEGYNAPSVSIDLGANLAIDHEQQRQLLESDPEVLGHLLAINARRRTLSLGHTHERPRVIEVDGRGGLGDPHEPEGSPLDHGPAPGRDQPPLDEGDPR